MELAPRASSLIRFLNLGTGSTAGGNNKQGVGGWGEGRQGTTYINPLQYNYPLWLFHSVTLHIHISVSYFSKIFLFNSHFASPFIIIFYNYVCVFCWAPSISYIMCVCLCVDGCHQFFVFLEVSLCHCKSRVCLYLNRLSYCVFLMFIMC